MNSNTESDADRLAESNNEAESPESHEPESLIERLIASGVLATRDGEAEESGTSGEIVLAETFLDSIRGSGRLLSAGDGTAPGVDAGGPIDEGDRERVKELLAATGDEEIAAEYLALVRAGIDGFTHEDRLRSLPLLDTLRADVADEGSPDPFVPVRGPFLPVVLPLYERAIVYTWREDCPPCDLMREGFEELFGEPPADIALFSVYGPAHAEMLHEHYDVIGGPTTLFCYRGAVDARLTGGHAEPIIESEVRKLREVTAADDRTVDESGKS